MFYYEPYCDVGHIRVTIETTEDKVSRLREALEPIVNGTKKIMMPVSDNDPNIRSPTERFPDEAGQPLMNFDRPKIGGGQPPEPELRQHDPPPSE